MECKIDPNLPYTDLSTMIRRQRQVRCSERENVVFMDGKKFSAANNVNS